MKYICLLLLGAFFCTVAHGQVDLHACAGNWEGKWDDPGAFGLHLGVRALGADRYRLVVYGRDTLVSRDFKMGSGAVSAGAGEASTGETFAVRLDSGLTFKGRWDGARIEGFMCAGRLDYHVVLSGKGFLSGSWNPLLVAVPDSVAYLDVEVDSTGGGYEAYPFLQDNRWTGFWAFRFSRVGDSLFFTDAKTGLGFRARLWDTAHISLEAMLGGRRLAAVELRPSTRSWNLQRPFERVSFLGRRPEGGRRSQEARGQDGDGWPLASALDGGLDTAHLARMEDSVYAGTLTHVHSVLVARHGKLLYEGYFEGYDASVPHDLRSAAKSVASAITGLAITHHRLVSDEARVFPLLPWPYRDAGRGDSLKQAIRIKDLLTMSSGLDAVDFGIDRTSPGSEDVYQTTPDWLQTVVNVSMLSGPGQHALYSSANPYLLGVIVDSLVGPDPEHFMDRFLFEPLGITDYVLQQDDRGRPYFGGGWYLRPRDMLTFGQAYLDGGLWKGHRVLSEDWVKKSTMTRLILENHPEKPGYGYLWWSYSYTVGTRTYKTIEARGAGGQYIFLVPSEGLVVVVTSGNFRNGRTNQPEKIFGDYILAGLH